VLQYVAVCCSVLRSLRCVAVFCGVMFVPMDYDGSILLALESDCLLDGVLHSVAVSCSVRRLALAADCPWDGMFLHET